MPKSSSRRSARSVLWAAFGLGVLFGAIAQRTHFCTMGAVADIVTSATGRACACGCWRWRGDARLQRDGRARLARCRPQPSTAAPRLTWLSQIVGGLMFGFGMVLASGCGSKTLVRIGGGNLKSLVVFCGAGRAGIRDAEGHHRGAARRTRSTRCARRCRRARTCRRWLASAIGAARGTLALVLGLLIGGGSSPGVLAQREGRARRAAGGIGIGARDRRGVVGVGPARLRAEHPQTLERCSSPPTRAAWRRSASSSPLAYSVDWLLFFSDKSKLLTHRHRRTCRRACSAGACALAARSFRWEGFRGVEDTANHMVGAALMGVGGVTALGCTIGQGVSGLSTLALGSFVAFGAIVAGAV
jgi:uncharacterized membrane protein YedE/YeeE